MNYCQLPLTDKRRAYVPSDHTDVAETIRQHTPIQVSPVHPASNYADDYDLTENTSHLDFIGGFK